MDQRTGGAIYLFRTLAEAKEHVFSDWVRNSDPFAVAVPSVLVPVWNVVLYPQGKGFWDHVALESVERFTFDPRLFPENTPSEPEPKVAGTQE